ncbi:MAG: hypothetical protein HZB55_14920 [Deltaproteobacteria bacterium]|nr:hypothetical protein [Deltaproteobacteria bacterium]
MVYEYALDPQLLANPKDFRYFFEKFGVARGRLIARLPSRWRKAVLDVIEASGDWKQVEKHAIKERILHLEKNAVVARAHEWSEPGWLKNVLAEHARKPFRAILAAGEAVDHPDLLRGEVVYEMDDPRWFVETSTSIDRTAQAMAACGTLLLRAAREVVFVDRNFRPDKPQWRAPLRAFLCCLADRPDLRHIRRAEYHTHNEPRNRRPGFSAEDYQQELRSVVPDGVQLGIVAWPWETLHNRYILTDIGGIQFGWGLDEAPGKRDQTNLLSESVWRELWSHHSERTSFCSIGRKPGG